MREIKTEAQTLDLSKKVIVEVSLAELMLMLAALTEGDEEKIYENIALAYTESAIDGIENAELTLGDIAKTIDVIIDEHIPEED